MKSSRIGKKTFLPTAGLYFSLAAAAVFPVTAFSDAEFLAKLEVDETACELALDTSALEGGVVELIAKVSDLKSSGGTSLHPITVVVSGSTPFIESCRYQLTASIETIDGVISQVALDDTELEGLGAGLSFDTNLYIEWNLAAVSAIAASSANPTVSDKIIITAGLGIAAL